MYQTSFCNISYFFTFILQISSENFVRVKIFYNELNHKKVVQSTYYGVSVDELLGDVSSQPFDVSDVYSSYYLLWLAVNAWLFDLESIFFSFLAGVPLWWRWRTNGTLDWNFNHIYRRVWWTTGLSMSSGSAKISIRKCKNVRRVCLNHLNKL